MKRRTGQKMRKKIKESPIRFRITAAMCLSAAAILLGGCSLAVPGAGTEEAGDRLIGLFITPEPLDLYDTEGYLQDHGAQLMNQDEIILENAPDYAERLYADIDRQGKEDPSEWEVTFGEVSGIRFFTPLWTDENGETYWGNVTDEELCDVRINVNTTDQGEEKELEGSFYFLPGQMDKDIAYYPNPVFQTADGRIYTTSGSGFGTSGDSADGIKLTKSFASETTTEESGKVTTDKSTVTINLGTKKQAVEGDPGTDGSGTSGEKPAGICSGTASRNVGFGSGYCLPGGRDLAGESGRRACCFQTARRTRRRGNGKPHDFL